MLLTDLDDYIYIPILSISPAEMVALDELPDKDKGKILPVFSLKGWATSKQLCKSIERIKKSIGEKKWIADIDINYLLKKEKESRLKGTEVGDVVKEIKKLLEPHDGYRNWVEFIETHPDIIPTIQLYELSELISQVHNLGALGRGISLKFNMLSIDEQEAIHICARVREYYNESIIIIFDYGDIKRAFLEKIPQIAQFIRQCTSMFSTSKVCLSCTSFPDSFAGTHHGEASIYERQAYNRIRQLLTGIDLIYSDRGSARANKSGGGARTPPPRIDYPLKDEWKYVRIDFDDINNSKEEKYIVYKRIANEILNSSYWKTNLLLWGTQQIELTGTGNKFGIYDQRKAAAVRINIHLYTQLHYYSSVAIEDIDSDDDWVD